MTGTLDPNLESRIQRFISHFRGCIDEIKGFAFTREQEQYRKMLFFSVLEALAKARYPKKRAGERVVKFVNQFSDWPERNKVSLPHLVAALERAKDKDNKFQNLRVELCKRLETWSSGTFPSHGLDRDPEYREIQRLWPKQDSRPLPLCLCPKQDSRPLPRRSSKLNLESFRHVRLLYNYRNYLIHQSREPTLSFEEPSDRKPFYESVEEEDLSTGAMIQTWHLVYPSGFLFHLCLNCLETFEGYLRQERRDPYQSFNFDSYVIEELNDKSRFPVIYPCDKTRRMIGDG